ncbi:pachytene checkpoint protein 2 homolog [Artemia franciscana]|uniref:AAA+ ATPase domain-containing protein n=1 Tax=Artemia franciscana TaxID=6661 RepID=A0AA88KYN7_ARTSF|nr:hypothetical protein QYM36_011242 [Artemia franciscana]
MNFVSQLNDGNGRDVNHYPKHLKLYNLIVECAVKDLNFEERKQQIIQHLKSSISSLESITRAEFYLDPKILGSLDFELDYIQCFVAPLKSLKLGSEVEFPFNTSCISDIKVHVFKLSNDEPAEECLDDEEEDSVAATVWTVPSREWIYLWDSLIYDEGIKEKLLHYAYVSMMLADKRIKKDILCVNKVILLYGPTGSGKTSLCKALAQKLAIRFSNRFSSANLVEINSHSLFSKYFSESGKLVQKMFNSIYELAENPNSLVMVLIDEVESLALARKSAANRSEPGDSIRVVNAMLTQLDRIKKFPNVLIFVTSNMTSSIDLAFVDRADIKQYIGNPKCGVIESILESCIKELIQKGVLSSDRAQGESRLRNGTSKGELYFNDTLKEIAVKCEGLSGRCLRKLPVLALVDGCYDEVMPLSEFFFSLSSVIDKQHKVQAELGQEFL